VTAVVWRIAAEAPTYAAGDLSGTGAKMSGGRWNAKGTAMVYCGSNIALATLETVHNVSSGALPLNRYLVCLEIPDPVWDERQILAPLPEGGTLYRRASHRNRMERSGSEAELAH
jgi:RES domain-containing protein